MTRRPHALTVSGGVDFDFSLSLKCRSITRASCTGPFPDNPPNKFLTNLSGLSSFSAPILSLFWLGIHASPGEVHMSLTVFLAFCILGCDFLLYVLFQWIYGEKHRKHARRVAARREKRSALSAKEVGEPGVLPFPQHSMHQRTGYF